MVSQFSLGGAYAAGYMRSTSLYKEVSVEIDVTARFNVIHKEKPPSQLALALMAYVAGSTRLSSDEKSAVTRLAAIIDEHDGGNPKLMRDLAGVVALMESDTPASTYGNHSFREVMELYRDYRGEQIGGSVEISISAQIQQLMVGKVTQGNQPFTSNTLYA